MKIKITLATDNGKELTKEHFGSAKNYLTYLYNLKNGNIEFLKKIKNTTPEEKTHGDSEKAKAVSKALKDSKVFVNLVFGPNISKIRKTFIPVVSRIKEIERVLEKLKKVNKEIKENLNKDKKDIIYLN